MPNLIIDKRGLFWPATLQYPADQFAPQGSIAGALSIDVDGRIDLRLDGILQISETRRRTPFDTFPDNFEIAGVLFGTNERVRLAEIMGAGGGSFSTNGPAHENLHPLFGIVGLSDSDVRKTPLEFGDLSFSLAGYEDWLYLRNAEQSVDEKTLIITHRRRDDISYSLSSGKLDLIYDVNLSGFGIPYSPVKIEEPVVLRYHPHECFQMERATELARFFDDLFLLLTNTVRNLKWPNLTNDDQATHATLYYSRGNQIKAEEVEAYKSWTSFPKISENFGAIVGTWLDKRQRLGSAFYMYTGTRRAAFIYSEHKFMSYVLGIESLHRRTANTESSDTLERVRRIVGETSNDDDKKWLQKRLKNAHEPNLEQRLFEVLVQLPVAFEETELRKFATRCAKSRNDLSHYAGVRDSAKQKEFYTELHTLTPALGYLYHAVILNEIGLGADAIQRIFTKIWGSFGIKETLKMAGIIVPQHHSASIG